MLESTINALETYTEKVTPHMHYLFGHRKLWRTIAVSEANEADYSCQRPMVSFLEAKDGLRPVSVSSRLVQLGSLVSCALSCVALGICFDLGHDILFDNSTEHA